MSDEVAALAESLSESYLKLLREKEDFFEFECDSYRLGFEIVAAAMSKALERFDDELFNAKPPSWKVNWAGWPRGLYIQRGCVLRCPAGRLSP